MRIVAVRVSVVLVCLCAAFPVSDLYGQEFGGGKYAKVLTSRHKFLVNEKKVKPAMAGRVDNAGTIRLVGRQNNEPQDLLALRLPDHTLQWDPLSFSNKLSAQSAIVMDGVSGKVLYALSPDRMRQPASTIKVLTGLLALEELRDSEMVKPSRRAAAMPRSKVYLSSRKSYAANDLINAVLLVSANDASVALAEKISGSERNFAALMTSKARSLGARNTICKTATGLTARGQCSTARDLAIIFNKAMDKSDFAGRVALSKVKTRYGKLLKNHNRALWQVHGAEGGKTGYTMAARQTYVGKFRRGDNEIVIALMGSETMWDDVKNLVEYGFAQKRLKSRMLTPVIGEPDVSDRIALIRNLYMVDAQQSALRVLVENENSQL